MAYKFTFVFDQSGNLLDIKRTGQSSLFNDFRDTYSLYSLATTFKQINPFTLVGTPLIDFAGAHAVLSSPHLDQQQKQRLLELLDTRRPWDAVDSEHVPAGYKPPTPVTDAAPPGPPGAKVITVFVDP